MSKPFGFKFRPDDKMIVGFYLKRLYIKGTPLPVMVRSTIVEADIYGEVPPWDIGRQYFPESRSHDFYVFTKLTKLSEKRVSRRVKNGKGTWKGQTVRKRIETASGWGGGVVVGEKMTFSFMVGENKQTTSHWNMTEYRLKEIDGKPIDEGAAYVICHVTFSNRSSSTSTTGADYVSNIVVNVNAEESIGEERMMSKRPCMMMSNNNNNPNYSSRDTPELYWPPPQFQMDQPYHHYGVFINEPGSSSALAAVHNVGGHEAHYDDQQHQLSYSLLASDYNHNPNPDDSALPALEYHMVQPNGFGVFINEPIVSLTASASAHNGGGYHQVHYDHQLISSDDHYYYQHQQQGSGEEVVMHDDQSTTPEDDGIQLRFDTEEFDDDVTVGIIYADTMNESPPLLTACWNQGSAKWGDAAAIAEANNLEALLHDHAAAHKQHHQFSHSPADYHHHHF